MDLEDHGLWRQKYEDSWEEKARSENQSSLLVFFLLKLVLGRRTSPSLESGF